MEKNKPQIIKECEFCNSNATCLCMKCNNYFCENCYKVIHNLQKYSNHNKENIDTFVPIDLKCPNHPLDRMNLFCIDEKGKFIYLFNYFLEICCSVCYYERLHDGHKILKLSDIEQLKKENIMIESTTKEFNEISQNIIILKEKIENEINKINNLF